MGNVNVCSYLSPKYMNVYSYIYTRINMICGVLYIFIFRTNVLSNLSN